MGTLLLLPEFWNAIGALLAVIGGARIIQKAVPVQPKTLAGKATKKVVDIASLGSDRRNV